MQCDVDTTTIETAIDSASPTAARQSRGRHGPASHALHSLQISLAAVERWQPSHPRVAVHQRCACQGITRGHDVVSHTHSLSLSLTHTHTHRDRIRMHTARTHTDRRTHTWRCDCVSTADAHAQAAVRRAAPRPQCTVALLRHTRRMCLAHGHLAQHDSQHRHRVRAWIRARKSEGLCAR
jgi:hypothetical protein